MKQVEVICQHKFDGRIIPIKFKIIDEDGFAQEFMIQRYKDKTIYQTDANGIKHTDSFYYSFVIVFEVFGEEKYADLRYSRNSNLWDISI